MLPFISFLADRASICKNQGFEARNDKPLSFLRAITSKWQVGAIPQELQGMDSANGIFVKRKEC